MWWAALHNWISIDNITSRENIMGFTRLQANQRSIPHLVCAFHVSLSSFDTSTLFKRLRMFCLATTTVLINCVSVELGLSCETFLFSSVLWLLCAIRDLHLPVTCRRRFLRLQLCKLQLQHGLEHAGAARLLSESKVYCLSFVKTYLNWLCSANWIAPKQLRILCRQALAVTFHCWGRVVGVGLKVLPDWTKHNGNRFDRRAVVHPKQTQTTNDCTITFKFLTCVAV